MNKLIQYTFNSSNVRTNNDPINTLFVAKDICDALGFTNSRKAIADHVDAEDKQNLSIVDSLGRKQKVVFINESGMYALIFGSKLESAKQFKRWVTSEVLPSIRKTGSYTLPDKISSAQALEIRRKVESIANVKSSNYSQLYKRLHNHFKVTSYRDIPATGFNEALELLDKPNDEDDDLPSVTLRGEDCLSLAKFILFWRYTMREPLRAYYQLLIATNSPQKSVFYDAISGIFTGYFEEYFKGTPYEITKLRDEDLNRTPRPMFY